MAFKSWQKIFVSSEMVAYLKVLVVFSFWEADIVSWPALYEKLSFPLQISVRQYPTMHYFGALNHITPIQQYSEVFWEYMHLVLQFFQLC